MVKLIQNHRGGLEQWTKETWWRLFLCCLQQFHLNFKVVISLINLRPFLIGEDKRPRIWSKHPLDALQICQFREWSRMCTQACYSLSVDAFFFRNTCRNFSELCACQFQLIWWLFGRWPRNLLFRIWIVLSSLRTEQTQTVSSDWHFKNPSVTKEKLISGAILALCL
jgi:hypothetical protein